ncbi:hypothetical protein [Methylobacterium oxalidis]|uniref:Uncharacterized protein n=1 Tax=Methylobacterium oxalidis TaxID=944322 RepID=A0A512J957_9HYPH|nr:hypothetical protein [Methylobacterium oxalidis]GEP06445.1 hypothetical protein MOX02_44830 [Methylobacterium oxalidis]GJE33529.1 hypothetical protein LDDCCGHA_3729 [Methylobacterium oxalidis]GLS65485.1 hypothetical protein GCM10007888_38670 [Methylobacterium oxalidis]
MSDRAELTDSGFVVRDPHGEAVAIVSFTPGKGEASVAIASSRAVEAVLPLAELKTFAETLARAHRAALLAQVTDDAAPCVPRSADLPAVTSPWG